MNSNSNIRPPMWHYVILGTIFLLILSASLFFNAQITGEATKSNQKVGLNGETMQAGSDLYVPGEFIVKLKPIGQIKSQSSGPTLSSLDAKYGVVSKKPLFKSAKKGISTQSISFQDNVKAIKNKYPLRTKRAPANAVVPDLDAVQIYTLSNKNANIEEIVKEYRSRPDVQYAQPNYYKELLYVPNDPYYHSKGSWGNLYDDLWGIKKIQAEKAWDSAQGEGIVVAIVDTGVDYNHPDIAANIWNNPGETGIDSSRRDKRSNGIDDDGNMFIDDWRGWSAYGEICVPSWTNGYVCNSPNDPMDKVGHGTHVAGTIAAIGNNNEGVIGVAPKAKIMALQAFGGFRSDDNFMARLIRYAADNGADIISNSWGCSARNTNGQLRPCPSEPVLEDAIRYAHSLGVVVVFAAGNDYGADVMIMSPQNMSEVITVASTDHNDVPSDFTNIGNNIFVSAPGGDSGPNAVGTHQNILSLRADKTVYGYPELFVGSKYVRFRGTSMATPHVSGLVALILSKHPALPIDEVKRIVRESADDILIPGFDTYTGYGRINAARALQTKGVYTLYRGWNMFGLDVIPSSQLFASSFAQRLKSLGGGNVIMIGFDATRGQAESYYSDPTKAILNNLFEVKIGKGYWIYVPATISLRVEGTAVISSSPVTLTTGWNYASFPTIPENFDFTIFARELKVQTGGDFIIMTFDPVKGQALAYYSDPKKAILNSMNTLQTGKGYQVYVKSPIKFRIESGGHIDVK